MQFRRGFVKENDLPALGLEGFVPVDIAELETLLNNAARTATESQGSGILSRSILSATLVGEDLVSDLSRLEVTGRSGSFRVRLEPMTLWCPKRIADSCQTDQLIWLRINRLISGSAGVVTARFVKTRESSILTFKYLRASMVRCCCDCHLRGESSHRCTWCVK
jgi:hypothetical protein